MVPVREQGQVLVDLKVARMVVPMELVLELVLVQELVGLKVAPLVVLQEDLTAVQMEDPLVALVAALMMLKRRYTSWVKEEVGDLW